MSNEDAINILSGNWGTAFTADDVPEIRRKAAAEARSALLKEVLAVVDRVDGIRPDVTDGYTAGIVTGWSNACEHIRTRLAALNQTENDDG